jgi:hypothetical protein
MLASIIMTNEMVGSTFFLLLQISVGVIIIFLLLFFISDSFTVISSSCFLLGRGEYTYPDGRRFVGEYKDDQPNGRGKQTSSDGAVLFDGGWNQGEFLGS